MDPTNQGEYIYESASACHTSRYVWPQVEALLKESLDGKSTSNSRLVFDLGCGNGAFLRRLHDIGMKSCGVDPSASGVKQANQKTSDICVNEGSAYDNLAEVYGKFPAVVSLEVVEHLYFPRLFARNLFDLVMPGGVAIVSTPYHGYTKNLMLALTGKLDAHFGPLWDHGHIKFWSVKTLTQLLNEVGFVDVRCQFAGRISLLAKSMIAVAYRPLDESRENARFSSVGQRRAA